MAGVAGLTVHQDVDVLFLARDFLDHTWKMNSTPLSITVRLREAMP